MSARDRSKWDRIFGEGGHGVSGPSPFLVRAAASLAPGRAAVPAMGAGRDALHLLERGWVVEGFDVSPVGVAEAMRRARAAGWPLRGFVADLDDHPLPRDRYDLVAVVHFLDRRLWRAIGSAVRPGGSLVYETFTRAHAEIGRPRNPAFLLEEGELLRAYEGWEVIAYEEGVVEESGRPKATARLHARRPS